MNDPYRGEHDCSYVLETKKLLAENEKLRDQKRQLWYDKFWKVIFFISAAVVMALVCFSSAFACSACTAHEQSKPCVESIVSINVEYTGQHYSCDTKNTLVTEILDGSHLLMHCKCPADAPVTP